MAKDVPVRSYLADFKVEEYSTLIRSHRLSAGLTQKALAEKIHSYISPRGANIISDYEKRRKLPDLEKTYLLSKALGIDSGSFFRMILKEHYINFIKRHLANFSRKTIKNEIKENRYFFCSRGRVIYSFKNFVQLIEEELKLKGKRKNDLRGYLIKRFSRTYIEGVLKGHKSPSIKMVLRISDFLEISALKLYKVMVEDKALSHAANMMREWDKLVLQFREKI